MEFNDRILSKEFENYYNDFEMLFKDEYTYYDNKVCPNCGSAYDKNISTRKCKFCKKQIVKHSNYLNKRNILVGEDKIEYLEKMKKEKSELLYYEGLLESDSFWYKEIADLINQNRSKNNNLNSLCFCVYSNLFSKYYEIAIGTFIKDYKHRTKESILEKRDFFFKSNHALKVMADLCYKANRFDVYETTICNYIYFTICSELLENVYYGEKHYDINDVKSFIYDKKLDNYIKDNNISLSNFKNTFLKNTSTFYFNTIDKEKVWPIFENVYFNKHNIVNLKVNKIDKYVYINRTKAKSQKNKNFKKNNVLKIIIIIILLLMLVSIISK